MDNPKPDIRSTGLDFTPLGLEVTKADVAAYKAKQPRSKLSDKKIFIGASLLGGVLVGVMLTGAVIAAINQNTGLIFLLLPIWVIMSLGIGFLTVFGYNYRYKRFVRIDRFAIANGLTFTFDQPSPSYPGMIFDEGRSRELRELLSFPGNTEIGNYVYVTGSGKSRSTHNYGYVRIKLDRKLPHMVLDARHNNFLAFSNLPDTFDKSQTLSLEGNFDTYYTLYAPQQYERDALYVFTPDVMAVLIDSGAKYDMEVIDDSLFIYHTAHFDLDSQAQLQQLAAIIQTIGAELKDQTEYYRDERVLDQAQNIVTSQGARLKKGVNYLVIGLVAFFVAHYFVGMIWPESLFITNLLVGVLIWGFIIFGIVKNFKNW